MSDDTNTEKLHNFDDLDIRILDLMYFKDITVMDIIKRRLKFMAHRVTVSKRIYILSKMNLLGIVKDSNPLCLYKNLKNEEVIQKMIKLLKSKRGLL